jgi:hypothetical protein
MHVPGHRGLLDTVAGRMFPAQPVEGLITEDDIRNAQQQGLLSLGAGLLAASGPQVGPRVTLGQAFGEALGGAQKGVESSLAGTADQRVAGLKFREMQNEIARKVQITKRRQEIMAAFPMPEEGNDDRMLKWIEGVYPKFIESGDDEMINRLTQVISSIGSRRNHMTSKIDEVVDPKTGKPAFGYVTPQGVQVIPGATPYERAGTQARARIQTLINPATGKAEIALFDPATNQFEFTGQVPGTSRDAGGTEGERKGAAQLMIVGSMAGILDGADAPDRLTRFLSQRQLNEFVEANRQRLEHAGMVVAEVFLRSMTGANAPENEVRTYMTMITPQPGDDKSLIEQKRALRRTWIEAIRIQAGRLADKADPYGDGSQYGFGKGRKQ